MKRFFLAFLAVCPLFAYADIIALKNGETVENVTVISVSADEVVYQQGGAQNTMASSLIEGVLYDDGRYITPPNKELTTVDDTQAADDRQSVDDSWGIDESTPVVTDARADDEDDGLDNFNILAYGKPVMGFYAADHEFDGATVEYRAISDANPNPDFEYLGTTPFAYLTQNEAKIISFMYKGVNEIIEIRPLAVPNNTKSIEFRISKDGYNTIVVKPIVRIDFGGRLILLPLNKLK